MGLGLGLVYIATLNKPLGRSRIFGCLSISSFNNWIDDGMNEVLNDSVRHLMGRSLVDALIAYGLALIIWTK